MAFASGRELTEVVPDGFADSRQPPNPGESLWRHLLNEMSAGAWLTLASPRFPAFPPHLALPSGVAANTSHAGFPPEPELGG